MKFKSKITDSEALKEFLNISNGLSKLSKVCVLRIIKKKIFFIVSDEDSGPKKPFIWCELPASFYFKEYKFSGFSSERNEIYLSFSTAMLSKTLNTAKYNIVSLKINLTNRDDMPCLTLEIEQKTDNPTNRQCDHNIPIEIIREDHWGDYVEPRFNDFHVSIEMPGLRSLKNIVERMKTMSPTIIVSANKRGKLTLKIETTTVKLSAHFPDLSVQSFAIGLSSCNNDEEQISATVDIKKFLLFLSGMQSNNSKTICSIVHNRMIKFYLENAGLSLQYFLMQVSI